VQPTSAAASFSFRRKPQACASTESSSAIPRTPAACGEATIATLLPGVGRSLSKQSAQASSSQHFRGDQPSQLAFAGRGPAGKAEAGHGAFGEAD